MTKEIDEERKAELVEKSENFLDSLTLIIINYCNLVIRIHEREMKEIKPRCKYFIPIDKTLYDFCLGVYKVEVSINSEDSNIKINMI